MRVVFITPKVGALYGQERVLESNCRILSALGHSFAIMAGESSHGMPELSSVIPELFQIHSLTDPFKVRKFIKQFLLQLRDLRPDLIHFVDLPDWRIVKAIQEKFNTVYTAHSVSPTCPASHRMIKNSQVCTKTSGLSCLYLNHEYGCLSHFKSPLHRFHATQEFLWKKKRLKHFSKVLAISNYIRDALIRDGLSHNKIHLVYNPVEFNSMSKNLEAKHSLPLLLSASRLVKLKGIDSALLALEKLVHLPWAYWIYGEGPEESYLKNLVRELGLDGRVQFKGRVETTVLREVMSQAHCYLQPNVGPEGFGLSVAEAAVQRLPTIAFGVPALNEVIRHGETGLLATPNSIEDFSQQIQKLLLHPKLGVELGQNAQNWVKQRFSVEQFARETMQVYQSVSTQTLYSLNFSQRKSPNAIANQDS